MTSNRQSSSSAPTLVVEGASFQGRLPTGRGTLASVGTAVAAVAIVVLGLAGPAVERPAPAAVTVAPSAALTEFQVLELRLLADARALATRLAHRQVTIQEVLEQRLLMEARTSE